MDEAQEKTSGAKKPDWARLAGHALDLWQAHLSSLASDPKAKEDMARLITPMGQAFADWTVMMQQSMESFTACASAAKPKSQTQPESSSFSTKTNTSSDDGVPFAPVHAESMEPSAEGESSGGRVDGEQPISAVIQPEPVSEPSVESAESVEPAVFIEPSTPPQSSPESGRASPADGPRDLAQLASRLAELERELDVLRARSRKRAEADSLASDGDVGRMAGTPSGATSS